MVRAEKSGPLPIRVLKRRERRVPESMALALDDAGERGSLAGFGGGEKFLVERRRAGRTPRDFINVHLRDDALDFYRRQGDARGRQFRSEEHTSELQSLRHLVCRLLL